MLLAAVAANGKAIMKLALENYPLGNAFDELIGPGYAPRPAALALLRYFQDLDDTELRARRAAIDAAIVTMGITFTIYSDGENIDRAWPFDPIPRVMARTEWQRIERGLKQRLTA